ncbi:MAG: FecR family protein [Desulfonauticus sp.]|nr:FecR family protein [Desulfonauticus sp.]
MRTILYGVGIIFLCFFLSSFALAENVEVNGKVKINFVQGKVLVNGKEVKEGEIFFPPLSVCVMKNSRLELLLPDNSVLRFNENSKFKLVKAVVDKEKRDIRTDLVLGECWASVQKMLGEDNKFEVSSPTAVAGVSGTKYRVVAQRDYSKFMVYDGKIKVSYRPVSEKYVPGKVLQKPHVVSGPGKISGPHKVSLKEWTTIVSKGYEFVVYSDGRFEKPRKFDLLQDKQNPWVQWNLERDKLLGM